MSESTNFGTSDVHEPLFGEETPQDRFRLVCQSCEGLRFITRHVPGGGSGLCCQKCGAMYVLVTEWVRRGVDLDRRKEYLDAGNDDPCDLGPLQSLADGLFAWGGLDSGDGASGLRFSLDDGGDQGSGS